MVAITLLAIAAGSALTITAGWVRRNGSVTYFKEADLPEGWPELTKVGEVEVKEYPSYREAVSTKEEKQFSSLFKHIKKNELPMTSPVEIKYSDDFDSMTSMAFLYPSL